MFASKSIPISAFAFLLVGVSACSLSGADDVERTYPAAADFDFIELSALKEVDSAPSFYNISVYVASVNVCPEDAQCYIPDGITVAAKGNAERQEEKLHLSVEKPRQFAEGQWYYILSVKVTEEAAKVAGSKGFVRPMELIGYSEKR